MKQMVSVCGGAALALALAIPALAAQNPPAPRAFNVTLDGYYLVTQSETSSQQSIKGIGIIDSDEAGDLSGSEVLTLANPSLPPNAPLTCDGSVGGSISANADGFYSMTLKFTPDSGQPSGCFNSTTSMECVRHVVKAKLVSDLAAGQYHCVATGASSDTSGVTIDSVSETAHFGAHVVDAEDGD
jgi:hypothetical protein